MTDLVESSIKNEEFISKIQNQSDSAVFWILFMDIFWRNIAKNSMFQKFLTLIPNK